MSSIILIQNVVLMDGTGREPRPNATVAVQDGKIIYAGGAKRWLASYDEDIIGLDFSGKYLLPGLIDAHVHLAGGGEADSQFKTDSGSMALRILQNARKNLAAGITTVRDLGGWNELEFAVRRAVRRHDFSAARMMLAGRFISISESGAERYEGMYRIADGVEAVRQAAREQIKNGADLIKLGVTGAVLVEDGLPGATHFNEEEIRVAVEEAAKFGKGVAAHAHGIDGIRKAVQAGVHSIEHGTFLYQGPDVIDEMKKRGTYLVPTLKPGWDVIRGDRSKIPPWIVEKTIETQEAAVQSLRLAYQAGLPIAMGSDAGTPLNFHGENGLEIYWMGQAGMQPMDALVSATLGAAKALGWDGQIGSIEEGKSADLLICNENPLDDLKRLADKKNLRAVFLDGKLAARQAADSYPASVLAPDLLTIGTA
ncbi:MAG TPA: amidohydrolase family protein [Anaerolineales bacterium]|nr:amidohydrolase family protein [Anaerolineales bacterium]